MSRKITTKKNFQGARQQPWLADTSKSYAENLESLKTFWQEQNGKKPEGVMLWRLENHLQKNYDFSTASKKRKPNMLHEFGRK